MRIGTAVLATLIALSLWACTRHDSRDAQAERDANSAAHKAGRAAYEITQESKEVAKKAGHKLREASREMRDGWNDAKHEAHENGKK
jgi:hypothetical protein